MPFLAGCNRALEPPEFLEPGDHAALVARDTYSWSLLVLRVMIDEQNPFKITPSFTLNPIDHDGVKLTRGSGGMRIYDLLNKPGQKGAGVCTKKGLAMLNFCRL